MFERIISARATWKGKSMAICVGYDNVIAKVIVVVHKRLFSSIKESKAEDAARMVPRNNENMNDDA
jgi:hypothetical protein